MKRILILVVTLTLLSTLNIFASTGAVDTVSQGLTFNLLADVDTAFAELAGEFDVIIAGILGTATLTSLLAFIIHFVKLATMPSHPIKRREVFMGIIWSGIILMLIGGVDIIVAVIYSTVMS